jgi:hypothetical protein
LQRTEPSLYMSDNTLCGYEYDYVYYEMFKAFKHALFRAKMSTYVLK